MADRLPVYVQLPGALDKTLAGELEWEAASEVGAFVYAPGYREQPGAYPIDPVNLRPPRPRKETRNHGLYGIVRDAGPDAWGRDMLRRVHGEMDELAQLRHAPEDGAGNLSFHPEPRLCAYSLADIDAVSRGFPPPDGLLAEALHPATSMGGAKPKLLAYDQGAFWIAKFPERGDPEYKNAANEHAMLQLAAACGIETCASRLHRLPDGRLILLARRFDLTGAPTRYSRLGFASAHTVLGMGDPRKDGPLKSYLLLRHEARRWTLVDPGPDLWRRLAFNALIANTDDHARNHALLYGGGWRLSPAFDLVASPTGGPVRLCLQIVPGSVLATPASLVQSAEAMGLAREAAIAGLRDVATTVLERWRALVGDAMSGPAVDALAGAFRLAEDVLAFDFAALPAPTRGKRYRARGFSGG